MDQIFGTNIDAQPSPDEENVFGTEPEVVEPEGQDGAEEPLDGPEEPVEEPEGQPEPSEITLPSKFKSEDAMLDSYDNLCKQLGREPQAEFSSLEEAVEAYKQAEKEFSTRKQPKPDQRVDNSLSLPDESAQLRQQVYAQQQQLQQYAQYLQALQMQQQQPQQQQAQPQTKQEPIDPKAFLDEFYENPNGAIEKLVQPRLQQEVQQLQQQYSQQLQQLQAQAQPAQQYVAQKAQEDNWSKQAETLQSQIPDFKEYSEDMYAEFQRDPKLIQYAVSYPDGMSMALREAYNRVKQTKLITQGQQLQQQANVTQQQVAQQQNRIAKQAARIQSGGNKRIQRQLSPEEAEVDAIFGSDNKKQGIFG